MSILFRIDYYNLSSFFHSFSSLRSVLAVLRHNPPPSPVDLYLIPLEVLQRLQQQQPVVRRITRDAARRGN